MEASFGSISRQADGLAMVGVLVGASAIAIQSWVHRSSPATAILLAAFTVGAVWLSVIDIREHRLPNQLVGALTVLMAAGLLINGFVENDIARSARSLAIGVAAFAILLVVHVVSAGGVGMGDVKFALPVFAVVGWFGIDSVYLAMAAASVAAALALLVSFARGGGWSQRLAFGPFLTVGAVLAVAAGGG